MTDPREPTMQESEDGHRFVPFLNLAPAAKARARERFNPDAPGRQGRWSDIRNWAFPVTDDGVLADSREVEPLDGEIPISIHLLPPRGDETACGIRTERAEACVPEINNVTCGECLSAHRAATEGEWPCGPWEADSDGHIYPEKTLGMGPDSPHGGPPHIAKVNRAWNNVGHYSADRIAQIITSTPELIGVLEETWNNLQALAGALEDGDVSAAELHLRDAFENVKYGLGQVE